MPDTHKTEKSATWIVVARSRLAQRRAEKPATKAGQIRALWPEIDAALAGGQSMKSIRKWLEEDAGISLGITSLTSYISRLRRRERANRRIEGPATQSIPAQTTVEPILAVLSARPRISTPRTIVSTSLRLAIPWRVGLHQSLPPLHQPTTILEEMRYFEKENSLNGNCR